MSLSLSVDTKKDGKRGQKKSSAPVSITSPAKSALIRKGSAKSSKKGIMVQNLENYIGENISEIPPKKIKTPSKSSIFSKKSKFEIVRAPKKPLSARSKPISERSKISKSSFVEKPAEPILIDGTADNKEDQSH